MNRMFDLADILLPQAGVSPEKWSVVACDQFTSRPDYWDRVKTRCAGVPSTCHIICPECDLGSISLEEKGTQIAHTMQEYLHRGVLRCYPNALILVRRHQQDGSVREGLVGQVDLEQYDYHKGAGSLVRATEETVPSRLPARQKLREHALLELPHLLILMDDAKKQIVETLSAARNGYQKLYDFELMENGGRIEGYLVAKEDAAKAVEQINAFADPDAFAKAYGSDAAASGVLALAVGDGNHSLAAAKQCYEDQKATFGPQSKEAAACRFALAEVENLHQDALQFEAIHRVVFGTTLDAVTAAMQAAFAGQKLELLSGDLLEQMADQGKQAFVICAGDKQVTAVLHNPPHLLAVGSLQQFLDVWCKENHLQIDYIHGADEVLNFCRTGENVGFLLPDMPKQHLYPTVLRYGALPRKTFSMGHAAEKRYYLEAKRIAPADEAVI